MAVGLSGVKWQFEVIFWLEEKDRESQLGNLGVIFANFVDVRADFEMVFA
jgi:hypothetical protein